MEILVWLLSAILQIIMCFICLTLCGVLILVCGGKYEFKNPIGIVVIMSLILIVLIAMKSLAG